MTRTLHLRRQEGERERTDQDGEEDIHDVTSIRLAPIDERRAEIERKRVRRVDNKEEHSKASAVPCRRLHVHLVRLADEHVVQIS